MRLVPAALAVLLAAVLPGLAEARDVRAAGPVVALGTTGVEVAYAARHSPGCTEIRVWDTADRGVRRYASHCFAATSTGGGVAAVAVANRRALWLTFTGGNIREWSLWTKSRGGPAKRLRFVARDVDAPPPLVVGTAWEGSLPYALDRTIVVLRPDGARRFAVEAPSRVVALAAHSRGHAAVLANGNVFTVSPTGAPLREYEYAPGDVHAAVLAGPGLMAMTRAGLEVHEGRATTRTALTPGWRFAGFSQDVLAYRTPDELRLHRRSNGNDIRFRRPLPAHAQLGRLGLGHARGSTVSFVAWAVVRNAV